MNYNIVRIFNALPLPLKNLALFVGGKERGEFLFQKGWVREFVKNKGKVLEYWKKFRYFDDIVKICDINDNSKILDVGCGISSVLHYLPGEKHGIDTLAAKYKSIYDYPDDIDIIEAPGEKIPFDNKYFDFVICSNALDHTENPEYVLNEVDRVLKDDGKFILTVEVFKAEVARDPSHPHCFTKSFVEKLVTEKFDVILFKESPWISMRAYVNGITKPDNIELVMILEKK